MHLDTTQYRCEWRHADSINRCELVLGHPGGHRFEKMIPQRPDAAPPPSDAAHVHTCLCGCVFKWSHDSQQPPRLEFCEAHAHPEDTPGGPWEIGSTLDQDTFVVNSKSESGFGGPFTWAQAIAVRNALNREVRDKGDKADD